METITSKKFPSPLGQTGTQQITKLKMSIYMYVHAHVHTHTQRKNSIHLQDLKKNKSVID